MHNYMARKPYNVVSEIIKRFCPDGGCVYDPIFGSGTTIIEASKLGRKAIGFTVRRVTTRSGKGKSIQLLRKCAGRKTHCPHCGRRLSVISESDRWTNGKPRFKYVCPGYRKKECNFKAVDGVLLDEFVVQQLSELSDENSEGFRRILEIKIEEVLVTLIQTIVERIYIVDKDDERYCHIFIKGCSGEDYTGFFQTAGYIEQNTVPVCDSEQYCTRHGVYQKTT